MAERTTPDAISEIFAMLTADFEDASAIAASAQSVRSQRQMKQAARHIAQLLLRIETRLGELEALLE